MKSASSHTLHATHPTSSNLVHATLGPRRPQGVYDQHNHNERQTEAQADGSLRLRMDPYRKTQGRLLSLHLIWEQFHKHLRDIPIAFLKIIKSGSIYEEIYSLVAQLEKNLPAMRETWVGTWETWRREWLPTPVFWHGEFHSLSQRVGHDWASFTHIPINRKQKFFWAEHNYSILTFASQFAFILCLIFTVTLRDRHYHLYWESKIDSGTSRVVQWLRTHLPVQGTRVQSLARN